MQQLYARTIPTRVGNTSSNSVYQAQTKDHPHAGGEYLAPSQVTTLYNGPSPRGWGIPACPIVLPGCRRTIPTRVGNTPHSGHAPLRVPDHPHAGGEYKRDRDALDAQDGPSPRGWGIPTTVTPVFPMTRTIPTRVGNTDQCNVLHVVTMDHPHAGGEYSACPPSLDSLSGPSPRGWGIRRHVVKGMLHFRTIPTRVGNTMATPRNINSATDHPHAGGEYLSLRLASRSMVGPSPRGWGIPLTSTNSCRPSRTIPTRVGNTLSASLDARQLTDHPHAGGEYLCPNYGPGTRVGPSPRGWGILSAGRGT